MNYSEGDSDTSTVPAAVEPMTEAAAACLTVGSVSSAEPWTEGWASWGMQQVVPVPSLDWRVGKGAETEEKSTALPRELAKK